MAGEARGSASLPLQVVVYFHYWFAGFFFLLTLALLVYKGATRGAPTRGSPTDALRPRRPGYDLPYPASVYGMEVSLCFFFAVVEAVRLFSRAWEARDRAAVVFVAPPPRRRAAPPSVSLGNRTEQTSPLLFGVVMSALGILCHVYYMRLQTYVYGLARSATAQRRSSPHHPPRPIRRARCPTQPHATVPPAGSRSRSRLTPWQSRSSAWRCCSAW